MNEKLIDTSLLDQKDALSEEEYDEEELLEVEETSKGHTLH